MLSNDQAGEKPVSQFRLMLWLKLRLMRGAFKRDKAAIIGTIVMVCIFLPFSLGAAFLIYGFAHGRPDLAPLIFRAVLAVAYVFWVLTPLFGFAMNESYDPTRLFVYPVRFQTIFAANVVGSLFETTTLLFLPVLIALLAATSTSIPVFIFSVIVLLIFLLQTIALGQAVSLMLIGFLRSRRFRDLMIVFVPLLAMSRYFFTRGYVSAVNISGILSTPAWSIADYLPPGWTAAALTAARNGDWIKAGGLTLLLLVAAALIVALAAFILKLLFNGDRGTSIGAAKAKVAKSKPEVGSFKKEKDTVGIRGPVMALAQKEWLYIVRDPQYKAIGINALYVMGIWGFSLLQGHTHKLIESGESAGGWIGHLLLIGTPLLFTDFILLFTMQLTFNIFGGEGAAITMLLSFPVPRRNIVMGKNLAYGSIILAVQVVGVVILAVVLHTLDTLLEALLWTVMATTVVISAGNLISVSMPTKLVTRAGAMSRSGRVNAGTRSPGIGCLYVLLYLLFAAGAFVAEIPALVAVILPEADIIPPIWSVVTIPLGLAYSFGLYWMSLKIIDSGWMLTQEPNIIKRLVPAE